MTFTGPPDPVAITGALIINIGDDLNLQCDNCQGYPPPTLQWTDEAGAVLFPRTALATEECIDTTLVVPNVQQSQDRDKYTCTSANGMQPDAVEEVQMRVNGKDI